MSLLPSLLMGPSTAGPSLEWGGWGAGRRAGGSATLLSVVGSAVFCSIFMRSALSPHFSPLFFTHFCFGFCVSLLFCTLFCFRLAIRHATVSWLRLRPRCPIRCLPIYFLVHLYACASVYIESRSNARENCNVCSSQLLFVVD